MNECIEAIQSYAEYSRAAMSSGSLGPVIMLGILAVCGWLANRMERKTTDD